MVVDGENVKYLQDQGEVKAPKTEDNDVGKINHVEAEFNFDLSSLSA